jgi:hypothetical protein
MAAELHRNCNCAPRISSWSKEWRAHLDTARLCVVFTRSNLRICFAHLILVCCVVFTASANAQLVKVEAGASDLLPSEGGSISFQGPNYTGYLGVGQLDGSFGIGALLKTSYRSHVITMGDQPIGFDLPTDIFGMNHFYPTRGIGVTAREGKANVFLFAGGTTLVRGTPFFQSARADLPVGMLFTDVGVSPTLHFYSKSVVSRRRTSIQAVDWLARKWLRTGFAAGMGSNQPYFATSADAETSWLSLKTSYVVAGDRFSRITASSIFASEVTRENISAIIKPATSVLLTLGHQNLLQPQSGAPNTPFLHATVNQLQTTFEVREFRIGAGVFQSFFEGRSSAAEDFSASRKITNNLDMSVNYFRMLSGSGSLGGNLSASIRETISPRLSLLQVVNRAQGRTTVLYGGNYLSNSFSVGVDYQTLYLPFRANPFSQGINVSLQVRLPDGVQVNAQTFRSPTGQLRYTAAGNGILTSNFRPRVDESQKSFKRQRYLVRGRVEDEKGQPVEGAALQIGDDLVFTNAAGEFFVREKGAVILPMQVRLTEFLNPGNFRVVSCPATAIAAMDDRSVQIVVSLARN